MALANDLRERERQAGNAEDSLDPGQQRYNEQFNDIAKAEEDRDFDQIIADNYSDDVSDEWVGSDGSKSPRNYNADEPEDSREAVKDREENPNSIYRQGSGVRGGLATWFMRNAKRYGASGGVLGVLGGGMIVISVTLSPAALFATIEKSVTNDGSDSSRTNSAMFRAFRGGLFSGECTGSKLKCKFVNGTKNLMKKFTDNRFKIRGIIVDADNKPVSGGEREIKPDEMKDGERVRMTSAEFPNGTVVRSNAEFEAETDRHIESRKWGLRVIQDKAGPFFTAKFNKVLSKFGLSKGTIAKKDSKPSQKDQAAAKVEEETDKARSKVLGSFDRIAAANGIVTDGILTACTVYNITRIAVGAVKAKWIADIVAFAFPFVQIASKIADGSATDEDFAEIEGRADQLVWYPNAAYTEQLATEDPDNADTIRAKQDLTATDAQGLRMAMYGDTTALTDFTLAYTTGGIGSVAVASRAIKEVQDAFGGKQNIRQICIEANRAGLAAAGGQAVACVIGAVTIIGGVVCLAKGAAATAAYVGAAYLLTKYGTDLLIKALQAADLPSDLRGVDAGNALAAGIGLMLSRTSRGYGLKPASSVDQVRKFIAQTDDVYTKDYTEIAQYEAKSNPFDLYNEYSFASIVNRSLNPYISGEKTGFSAIANAFGVVSSSLLPSANALYSQPSLMTNNEENLEHRLNVDKNTGKAKCPDEDKQEIDIVCDWSGRMVGITSDRVLEWANQMAKGDVAPLNDTIDYMRQEGQFKNVGELGEPDGGTYDETCLDEDNFLAGALGDSCDNSKKESINEDGSVVTDSQYDKYKKFCTEDRELDLGSADDAVESGSEKDQDWITGKQCAKDSMMMDRFAFFFNMCEGQYAMANDAVDCTNDGVQSLAATTNTGSWVIPTSGPCLSPYGPRWGGLHAGIDISPPSGTPIVAPTDMTITGAEYNSGGYGNMITAKADDGTEYSFRFGHMLSNSGTVGAKVKKGTEIGKVGSTGDSSGPHLHFEIFPPGGNPATYSGAVDPVPILAKNGVSISCG